MQRFTPLLIEAARPCRHCRGDRWFVNETYEKVAGRWIYLYRAIDQFGQVIAVLVSQKRDLTTTRRFFTHAQRRAIIARDGDRCPVPYCDRPISWADAHHLIPVGRNGPTTVANGAIPCDGHHTLLHEGHWQLHRLPDGRYLMTHPGTGRSIGPEEHPPGHNRPTPRPPPDHPD